MPTPSHVTFRTLPAWRLIVRIAGAYGIEPEAVLTTSGRKGPQVEVRAICLIALYDGLGLSTIQLGELFCYAQHSSALYAINAAKDRLKSDRQFRRLYHQTLAQLAIEPAAHEV